jgi:hypothetical protein
MIATGALEDDKTIRIWCRQVQLEHTQSSENENAETHKSIQILAESTQSMMDCGPESTLSTTKQLHERNEGRNSDQSQTSISSDENSSIFVDNVDSMKIEPVAGAFKSGQITSNDVPSVSEPVSQNEDSSKMELINPDSCF